MGTIIGSGIFKTAPIVASNAGGWVWMTVLWVGGGLLSLVGAICFAELTTRYRNEVGGDFIYLKKAFGSPLAFMFAWAAFWIVSILLCFASLVAGDIRLTPHGRK